MAKVYSSLVDRIKETITEFKPTVLSWVTFVKDHRVLIEQNSTKRSILNEEKYRFKYRLFEYLESIRYDTKHMWIVMWLNDLNTQQDFYLKDSIVLPDMSYLHTLRENYRSYISKYKSVTEGA